VPRASSRRSRAILRLCVGSAGSLRSTSHRCVCSSQYERCSVETAKLRQRAQVDGSGIPDWGPRRLQPHAKPNDTLGCCADHGMQETRPEDPLNSPCSTPPAAGRRPPRSTTPHRSRNSRINPAAFAKQSSSPSRFHNRFPPIDT
jgi:hypothetical protein